MASSSPRPTGRHADGDEDPAVTVQVGESGREGRGGRLRPPPPVAHAPLLLGIDRQGGEHPQGPDQVDDESLAGRAWGCVCGWRGTVRDVSTRPFHPRVGDGGRLRRQRLARSDRDARSELDTHFTRAMRPAAPSEPPDHAAPATPAPGATHTSPAVDHFAGPGGDRPRRPRRRLTLPRAPAHPEPAPLATAAPTPEHDQTRAAFATEGALDPTPRANAGRDPDAITYLPAQGETPGAAPLPALGVDDASPEPRDETLTAAAKRARAARDELRAADAALDTLVARAREEGASWRSIAKAIGVPHREAATRWADPNNGAAL